MKKVKCRQKLKQNTKIQNKNARKVNVSDVNLSPEIILSALQLDDMDRDVFSVLFVPPHGEAEFMPESSSAQLTLSIKSKTIYRAIFLSIALAVK